MEDISHVEQFVYGEELPIEEITGIAFEKLPLPEDLDEQQKAILSKALLQLLDHHNFELDFPENYPLAMRYAFIYDFWPTEQVPLTYGANHIELCNYDQDECPFPDYCNSCEEIKAELEADKERDKNTEEPFEFEIDDLLPSVEELRNFFGDAAEDDGRLTHDMLPIPGLCLVCQKYQLEQKQDDENLSCKRIRHIQQGKNQFECDDFETV